jgi:hypothetical protein
MIRFKDISIPKPCSVDYDALPGDEVKRFCGSCDKHVYDFRGKDEGYLNDVFLTTGKVCGVFHEDQIQKPSLKVQRPFYYGLATKLVSVALFLKTILSSYHTEASIQHIHQATQESMDSTKIKTIYKGQDYKKTSYYIEIEVYVNEEFRDSFTLKNSNNIYLPDSIKPEDKIKLIVTTTRYNISTSNRKQNPAKHKPNKGYYKTERRKEYRFNFSKSNEIIVKINYNKMTHVFLRKRNHVLGMICPPNFW